MKPPAVTASVSATDLSIDRLHAAYLGGVLTPTALMNAVMDRIELSRQEGIWISLLSREQVLEHAERLARTDPAGLPLYGIPFAIKDNIDLRGCRTTAACPDYAYVAQYSAVVVEKLMAAGAIPVGKTNLDQFATGLVGTRSPYGACANVFDERYIAGGSSSGSAVAVALGLVSFALGTDTAGSGRIPAAFNNIVGLKPSRGRLSTRGMVPACRSLDCVSIFALTADDAAQVLQVAEGFDADDPYSRPLTGPPLSGPGSTEHAASGARRRDARFIFGVPRKDHLQFFGDAQYERLFEQAVERAERIGGTRVEIDFSPFREAAELLYSGPWVAERYAALQDFMGKHPQALLPITRQIIQAGAAPSAVDLFNAEHRLARLQRLADAVWKRIDVMLTPTAGTLYTKEAVAQAPLKLNSNLGYYTNFMNLLNLSAVAIPSGFRTDGLPFGITVFCPAGGDRELLAFGSRLHGAAETGSGALRCPVPPLDASASASPPLSLETIVVAVCGAHMQGLPLNHQLIERGAFFIERTRTAATYKFYGLAGGPPQRPGLVRVADGGAQIEVELWGMPAEQFGTFVAIIPSPLAVGKVLLEDAEQVSGFLCEPHGVADARDITAYGGWRNYLDATRSRSQP